MSSEKSMMHQEKANQVFDSEEFSELDKWEEQELGFPYNDEEKRRQTRRVDDLFHNYTRIENSSLWEERYRLNILRIFIEYFCMKKRIPLKDLLEGIERMIIVRVLSHFDGNQKIAAAFLGVKYTTLNEKIKRYNISTIKKVI